MLNFPSKLKKDNSSSFLYVKICRVKEKFTRSVFRKDTFSGVYTNFSSFLALEQKFTFVDALLHKRFTIMSDFSKFRFEVERLKKTRHKNAYPTKFVGKCIGKCLKFSNLKILFQAGNRLKNHFRFKDLDLKPASYYNRTYRHLKVRVSGHQGVSPRNR